MEGSGFHPNAWSAESMENPTPTKPSMTIVDRIQLFNRNHLASTTA